MFGLDAIMARAGGHGGLAMAFVVALLLGLRHATDPDHLTAVSTLILGDRRHGTRRASTLGFVWGMGHAVTLLALGLPVIAFGPYLPAAVHRAAEMTIGALIAVLSARLLLRWWQGAFHAHAHEHDGVQHAHPHAHAGAGADAHAHMHAEDLGRSLPASFGIGMIHGIGGSAGAAILLLASFPSRVQGAAALVVFAVGTALSMGIMSSALGYALVRNRSGRHFRRLIPVFGALGLLFGVWYGLRA